MTKNDLKLIKEHPDCTHTVAWGERIVLKVCPDYGKMRLPYFKVYHAGRVERVLFHKPEFVGHGKMSKEEVLELCLMLGQPNVAMESLSNWQYMLVTFNWELGLDMSESMENFCGSLKYPDYLPIDLPMPDYLQLV